MGIELTSSAFNIKNSKGEIKFSTDRRIPHLLYDIPGSFNVPPILASNPDARFVDEQNELILVTNRNINNENFFLLPFFKITGGPAETGNSVIVGGGSILIRIYRQPSTGEFLGSSIMTAIAENNSLKISVSNNIDRQGVRGTTTGDDLINISYRIYYGRY
jgi:hypothetical protein